MIIEKDWLEKRYLWDHLTLQQIGDEVGLTRQAIHWWVKRHGIDTSNAEKFKVRCNVCREEYETTRKRYNSTMSHFCSNKCRTQYMSNDDYFQWRQGLRIAREVMSSHIGRPLTEIEVVHHLDGDNHNNDISNLMLFPSNSKHIAHHHKLKQERILCLTLNGLN